MIASSHRRLSLAAAALLVCAAAFGADRARIPGATFATVLPPAPNVKLATVRAFDLDRRPVSNADFAKFVKSHADWRRDGVARVFADTGYLQHWQSAESPGERIAAQPVTHVSWFAASAYCEAHGARLPTWHEWELVAAASDRVADARADDAWRQKILGWYAEPAHGPLAAAGSGLPNYYGVRDIHGLVWEWVDDIASMMVSGDNRVQGDPDVAKFCGSGALSLEQKDNYAMMMRIAMLSSMQASFTSSTMGFRCAADAAPAP